MRDPPHPLQILYEFVVQLFLCFLSATLMYEAAICFTLRIMCE